MKKKTESTVRKPDPFLDHTDLGVVPDKGVMPFIEKGSQESQGFYDPSVNMVY